MKIENYKELDDIVCDEINVKNLERYLATTEEGRLYLNYNRKNREYTLVLANRSQVASDSFVEKILGKAQF